MFTDYQNFTHWLESRPVACPGEAEKGSMLTKTRELIKEHQLLSQIPVITVTGTNGKGSTVYALASLLIASGYRVGSMTSPHLFHYTERFRINLEAITEADLLAATNFLRNQFSLDEFNFAYILFLIGLKIFRDAALDILILEVGVGGRLDPSNALDADIVILTQVALDHTHLLGKTREAIGFEKTGLLRKNQLFICGDPQPPESVFRKARELDCQSFFLNQHFGIFENSATCDIWLPSKMLCGLPKPLMHPTSIASALIATAAFPAIKKLSLSTIKSLFATQLPGRCQRILYQGFDLIVDVAHNPAAVQHLADYIKTLPDNKNTVALFGAMQDKDIANILEILTPEINTWYLTDLPGKRAASAKRIANLLPSKTTKCFPSLEDAFKHLQRDLPVGSRIVVFGSFLVVGNLLQRCTL